MSTRGTYQITMQHTEKDGKILTHRDIDICIYSQNDNYPSGAVEKFKNTLKLQKELKEQLNNTDFIECFIAANIREYGYMEITGSYAQYHNGYPDYLLFSNKQRDTAYAYEILISDDIYLKCYKWGNNITTNECERVLYYDGLLMDFINNTAIEFLDK